jgi:hypothetical protein
MAEKTYGELSEGSARARIEAVLARLPQARQPDMETKAATDNSSVDYHIDNIIKAGGGLWNETIASDYLGNLETQVSAEKEAPIKSAGHSG